jgi:hypothetical protein
MKFIPFIYSILIFKEINIDGYFSKKKENDKRKKKAI